MLLLCLAGNNQLNLAVPATISQPIPVDNLLAQLTQTASATSAVTNILNNSSSTTCPCKKCCTSDLKTECPGDNPCCVVVCLKTLEKLKKLMASRGVCIAYGDCNKCEESCGKTLPPPAPIENPVVNTPTYSQSTDLGCTTSNVLAPDSSSCRYDGRAMANVTPADLDIASFLSSLPSMGQYVP